MGEFHNFFSFLWIFNLFQDQSTMKVTCVLVCLAAIAAMTTAAPQKRLLLDDLAGEGGKILVCEGKLHKEGCTACCESTTWYFDTEKTLCNAGCKILPSQDAYNTTPSN